MLAFARSSDPDLAAEPSFSAHDALHGTAGPPVPCDGPGHVRVEVDGRSESLRFYGAAPEGVPGPAVIFLDGDIFRRVDGVPGTEWEVPDAYGRGSPAGMQREAEERAAALGRSFVNLARPGTYGSSGDHRQRRRPRELALVDAAIDRLKRHFGWSRIDLAGLSGGGHLVAALIARRSDVGSAVIASGNVAVRRRLRERCLAVDVTGYADFVDPIDLVRDVARHPPRSVIMLTDPRDAIVSPSSQAAYVNALRGAGVRVEQRPASADDPQHHMVDMTAILACVPRP